jgi:hypothetical protein
VRTPETTAVLDTLVCRSLSTLLASLFQTASSPAVRYARVCLPHSTLLASLNITSLSFYDSVLEHWLRIHFRVMS